MKRERRDAEAPKQLPNELADREPVELADALERALASMAEETYDAELIQAYLDALEEKAPIPTGKSAQTAYQELEGAMRRQLKPRRVGRWRRYITATAAALGVAFLLMVGAQAAGWNVLGALAQWTDRTFHFVPNPVETGEELEETLRAGKLPPELTPGWYPDGFVMGEAEVDEEADGIFAVFPFSDGETGFQLEVSCYQGPTGVLSRVFFKNDSAVERYTGNGRSFYLFKNGPQRTAAWSDGESVVVSITGQITKADLKRMIDHLGIH